MINFLEAVKRPFADCKALVLGIVIGALPLVNFLLLGFGLGEAERTLHGRRKAMNWWDMCNILYKSTAAFAISVFYFSPVIMAAIFFLGPFIVELSSIINESGLIQLALWGSSPFELAKISMDAVNQISILVSENIFLIVPIVFLALLFYYILPFALINFVREEKAIEAFNSKIVRKALKPEFFFYWFLFHLYLFVLSAFLSLFFFLPLINFLLGGFILFVYFSSGFNLFTQLFLEE